ncbi:MAG: high-potential iron-sulfur protein [Candidatus Tumulicola sp.]
MKHIETKLTRRDFVRRAIVLPALAGLLYSAQSAPAQAKGSQAQYKYQNKPNGSKKCSGCTFYIAGKTSTANGSCKIVTGSISPNGYCIAYSPKSS